MQFCMATGDTWGFVLTMINTLFGDTQAISFVVPFGKLRNTSTFQRLDDC